MRIQNLMLRRIIAASLVSFFIGLGSTAHAADPTPVYSHDRCGGKSAKWRGYKPAPTAGELRNIVEIKGQSFLWNGTSVSRGNIAYLLRVVESMRPVPITIVLFWPDANCDDVSQFRISLDTAMDCRNTNRCIEYSKDEWVEIFSDLPKPSTVIAPSPTRKRHRRNAD